LNIGKTCFCMLQLAPVTISKNEGQLCGSCGADKTCVLLYVVARMRDQFLGQQINIKYSVKLGKNASDACAMLSKAYGEKL